mmetsp:Transcript_19822/g.26177  ORF Transcript_19822/g.26177 Transcript_19822/m.26177 type:complete len:85 (-) Transcript_19822:1094-1348(-)
MCIIYQTPAKSIKAKHQPIISEKPTLQHATQGNTQIQYHQLTSTAITYTPPPTKTPAESNMDDDTSISVTNGINANPANLTEIF